MKKVFFGVLILLIFSTCKKQETIINDDFIVVGEFNPNKMIMINLDTTFSFGGAGLRKDSLNLDVDNDGTIDIVLLFEDRYFPAEEHGTKMALIFYNSNTITEKADLTVARYFDGVNFTYRTYVDSLTLIKLFDENSKIIKDTLWTIDNTLDLCRHDENYVRNFSYKIIYGGQKIEEKYIVFMTAKYNKSFLGWIKISYDITERYIQYRVHNYCIQK